MAEANRQHHSTPVADDWNWTTRVKNELDANKAWQRNWGFLVEHNQPQQQPPSQQQKPGEIQQQLPLPAAANATGAAAGGGDALATFMQRQAGSKPGSFSSDSSLSYIAAKQRESARARRQLHQQDSLDGFVSTYMVKGDPRSRQLPAQEFRKPLITSHDYGWGRNLEVFGKMSLVMK